MKKNAHNRHPSSQHKNTVRRSKIEGTRVFLPDGTITDVPVGKDGYVPEDWLVGVANRVGSPVNDYDREASVQLPTKVTPRQAAAWVQNINDVDVDNIDIKGTPQIHTGSRTGERKRIHEKIKVYGTTTEEKKVRGLIDDSFTTDDLEKVTKKGDLEVVMRPEKDGVLGHTDQVSYVAYDRTKGTTNGVVVHEMVHYLRMNDLDRKGITKAVRSNPKLKGVSEKEKLNIEESCTVAESAARSKGSVQGSGYYWQVPVIDKKTGRWRSPTNAEAIRMAKEDRHLFTNGTDRALSSKAAIESVNKNWAKSNIARLRTNQSMAINAVARVDPDYKEYRVASERKKTQKSDKNPKRTNKKPSVQKSVSKPRTTTKRHNTLKQKK